MCCLFEKHLVSERSLELFQGVQFQQLGESLATTFVEQILDLQSYKPERRFGDAVKGLHVYGAKVVRPTALACLIADKS